MDVILQESLALSTDIRKVRDKFRQVPAAVKRVIRMTAMLEKLSEFCSSSVRAEIWVVALVKLREAREVHREAIEEGLQLHRETAAQLGILHSADTTSYAKKTIRGLCANMLKTDMEAMIDAGTDAGMAADRAMVYAEEACSRLEFP